MARVKFKEGQPIQSLSGTLGNSVFRTRNGQTFVHERSYPELPKDATRAQKARYRRRMMINECVSILQDEIEDIAEAISMRKKITERIGYLYDKYVNKRKARTKLQRKIMGEYRAKYRFGSVTSREKGRKKYDKVSEK